MRSQFPHRRARDANPGALLCLAGNSLWVIRSDWERLLATSFLLSIPADGTSAFTLCIVSQPCRHQYPPNLPHHNRGDPHLVTLADDDPCRNGRAGLHVGTEPPAEIIVANVGPKRPVQCATLLAMKDARIPISDRRDAREIKPQHRALCDVWPVEAHSSQGPLIQESVVVAIPATPALAERTSRLRNAGCETGGFRSHGGGEIESEACGECNVNGRFSDSGRLRYASRSCMA